MKKKMLMVACAPVMIKHFNMPNIRILQEMDYQVEVAFNCFADEMWSKKDWEEFKRQLDAERILVHQIDFTRSAGNLARHIKAYRQLKALVEKEKYEFIHCHTPIGAAITRIVAHRTGTKVIYTAHGFHFFSGAPIRNWLLYYPVEKFLSRWTDCLITINKEDYWRAKKKFHAKRTEYVPGVGVDLEKFHSGLVDVHAKRESLGVSDDDIMLLSVGELNRNKNHSTVVKAVAKLKDSSIQYVIAGQGELKKELGELAEKLGIAGQVHLLGFRSDIADIMRVTDLYCLPSLREGLNVSLMEAMASGLPCIASDIRGNRDLFEKEKEKYLVHKNNVKIWVKYIHYYIEHMEKEKRIAVERQKKMDNFSIYKIIIEMNRVYQEVIRSV